MRKADAVPMLAYVVQQGGRVAMESAGKAIVVGVWFGDEDEPRFGGVGADVGSLPTAIRAALEELYEEMDYAIESKAVIGFSAAEHRVWSKLDSSFRR